MSGGAESHPPQPPSLGLAYSGYFAYYCSLPDPGGDDPNENGLAEYDGSEWFHTAAVLAGGAKPLVRTQVHVPSRVDFRAILGGVGGARSNFSPLARGP